MNHKVQIRLASDLQPDSVVDGEGIRTVIWTQGCGHKCPGCQNPQTHDFNGGFAVDIEDVKEALMSLKGQDGITLSGGDPLFQVDASYEIAKYAHELGMNVWCYTGFTYEEILSNSKMCKILDEIDVLVDGKFLIEEFSLDLQFKGSKNQRIIDVKKSLEEGNVCLVEKYVDKKNYQPLYQKSDYMFI